MVFVDEDAQGVYFLEGHLVHQQLNGLFLVHREFLIRFQGFTRLKIKIRLIGVQLYHSRSIVGVSTVQLYTYDIWIYLDGCEFNIGVEFELNDELFISIRFQVSGCALVEHSMSNRMLIILIQTLHWGLLNERSQILGIWWLFLRITQHVHHF